MSVVCPAYAVVLEPHLCGQWFVSSTQLGAMVHASLKTWRRELGKIGVHPEKTARSACLPERRVLDSVGRSARRGLPL